MSDPQKGSEGDPPKDEGVDTEQIDWLDPFSDGEPDLPEMMKDE